MEQLTAVGQNIVNDIGYRYNLSQDAVIHMLVAVNNGGGTLAQFNCPELGGSGQWMSGGMTMVGDMFNYGLKNTVNNLCSELSNALANNQIFPTVTKGTLRSNVWWPDNLGIPSSSGSQNNIRYAVFPQRLAVEVNGQVTVYDTLNHSIGGVSQQQGGDTSLTFSSQFGTVGVNSLPIVSGPGLAPAPQTNFAAPAPHYSQPVVNTPPPYAAPVNQVAEQTSRENIISLIESLSRLREAGALTDDEFKNKKIELLNRL